MEISNAKSLTTAMQLPGCGEPSFSNSNNQNNYFLKTGDSLKHGTVSFKKSYYLFIYPNNYSDLFLQMSADYRICKDTNKSMLISGQQWLRPSTHIIKGNAYFQKHKAQICGSFSTVPPVSWLW